MPETIHDKHHKPMPTDFPAWYYGPKGESKMVNSKADVPAGWHDHPSKHASPPKSQVDAEKAKLNTGTAGASTGTTTDTGAGGTMSIAPGDFGDLDVDGHPWSPELHAATKSKTNDGRWRMRVGKTRPLPVEGYPKLDKAGQTKANTETGEPSVEPSTGPLDL